MLQKSCANYRYEFQLFVANAHITQDSPYLVPKFSKKERYDHLR